MNIKGILSQNIRTLRKVLSKKKGYKITQETMADLAGIPFPTYRAIELGISWPELANLEAIAKALEVPVARLFQEFVIQISPKQALKVLEDYVLKNNP